MPRAAKKAAPGSTGTRAAAPTSSRTGTSRSGAAGSSGTGRAAASTKKASSRVTSTPANKATAKKAAPKAAATKKATAEKAPAKKAPAKATATKAATKATTTKATTAKAPAAKKAAPAKKAAAKPAKVESPFDQKFLDAQRTLLNEERVRLVRDADNLTAEAISLAEGRDPGDVQFDEESGEGDTLAVERERDLALSAQFRGQVEEIDRALAKFELGTYGICEVSGTPIPRERLKAIPWARERVEYKVGGFGRR
jgi:RNA polymerase-binding transcription factor DksA